MISINTVCQNVRHKGNFEICRPDGSGDDLLVIFKTSAVLIQNGEEITVSPDSLILYSKEQCSITKLCAEVMLITLSILIRTIPSL